MAILHLANPLSLPHPGPRQYLVDRFIPAGKMVSLYGDGGLGKSLVCTYLACCVSSGTPFFGLPTRKGHVIYLDGEDDDDEFRRRSHAIQNAHRFVGPELGYHQVVQPINQAFIQSLKETIQRFKTVLVIVDSFSALSGGNLDNETIMTFMNSFRQLGIAIMFLDHEPKYNDTQLGPNSKKNQSRAQYHLEEWFDPSGKMLKLSQTKSNIGDMKEPIYLKVNSAPDTINPLTIRFDRAFPTPGSSSAPADKILSFVRTVSAATQPEIVLATSLSEGVCNSTLSRLVRDKKLKTDGAKPALYSLY
jgi:archaellum biogenesis ATPase FlaH